jgi:5-methylcytosine-specific restriction endonuclease McrA
MGEKRKFTYQERYAVWHCHGRRCWLCREPLRLVDATIDHFFPESLLKDDTLRRKALAEYGLTEEFSINGFANWLPCHASCNQAKGSKTTGFIPGKAFVLLELIKRAPEVERTARNVASNVKKDEVFRTLFVALERKTIETGDLQGLLGKLVEKPAARAIPDDIVLLDGGYWVYRRDVAREGYCQCERNSCVSSPQKVYCYFRSDLSAWVIRTGLYWKCYDEVIECPRCLEQHKRGHIGKRGVCASPFRDQELHVD